MTKHVSSLRVAVFMGGPSAEHEVSLKSGAQIMRALDRGRYQVTPVVISRKGMWKIGNAKPVSVGLGLATLVKMKIDVALILALHGEFGEDGRMQALLEAAGIPYTGSGVLASALGMDKVRSAELFRAHGLFVPPFVVCTKKEWKKDRKKFLTRARKEIGFPCVVKPVHLGSSVGVSIVKREGDLRRAIAKALKGDHEVMVQKYIRGLEITCGVLDTEKKPVALPTTEIVAKNASFFDYRAKYTPGASDEITPGRISASLTRRIQETALVAHEALGCRGISRTDMIVQIANRKLAYRTGRSQSAKVWVLEINTLPGMTATSLVPQAARVAGISFRELLDRIITGAIS